MPELPPGHEAAELVHWLRQGGRDALPEIGAELARRAARLTPPSPGEPRDPHPEITLAEDFKVRVYGDFVSVSNEDPYAVKQHEAIHFEHVHGGEAKFLERPAQEMARELAEFFAASITTRERSGRVRTRSLGG